MSRWSKDAYVNESDRTDSDGTQADGWGAGLTFLILTSWYHFPTIGSGQFVVSAVLCSAACGWAVARCRTLLDHRTASRIACTCLLFGVAALGVLGLFRGLAGSIVYSGEAEKTGWWQAVRTLADPSLLAVHVRAILYYRVFIHFSLLGILLAALHELSRFRPPAPAPEQSSFSQTAAATAGVIGHGPRWTARDLGLCTLYVPIAIGFTWPSLARLTTHVMGGGFDTWHYVWNLWWFRRAVVELHVNPFHAPDIFWPTGTTLLCHTFHPLNGAVSILLRGVFGLTTTYNLILLSVLIASGVGGYVLLRWLTNSGAASFLGGLIFMLSPYHMFHEAWHMHLASMEWIPLFVLFFVKMCADGKAWSAIVAALCFAACALSCNYYAFYCVLFGIAFVATIVVRQARPTALIPGFVFDRRDRMQGALSPMGRILTLTAIGVLGSVAAFHWHRQLVIGLIVALAARIAQLSLRLIPAKQKRGFVLFSIATFLLLSPVVVPMVGIMARGDVQGGWYAESGSADPTSFLIPGHSPFLRRLVGARPWEIGHESWNYLGILALFVAAYGVWRRVPGARFWAGTGAMFLAFALGPRLQVWGHKVPILQMPYSFLGTFFPFITYSGMPVRMVGMATFCLSIAVGLVAASRWRGRAGWRAMVLAALVLFEYYPGPFPTERVTVPAFYHQLARASRELLILDTQLGKSMFLQSVHRHRLVGGYVARPSREATKFIKARPILRFLLHPWLGRYDIPVPPADSVSTLTELGVDYVINADPIKQRFLEETLGLEPTEVDGDVRLYDVGRARPAAR